MLCAEPLVMETPDLFTVLVVLSPRLKWINAHRVRLHHCIEIGLDDWPWCAWLPANDDVLDVGPHDARKVGGIPRDPEACGYGHTEIEALENLAMLHGLTHWSVATP